VSINESAPSIPGVIWNFIDLISLCDIYSDGRISQKYCNCNKGNGKSVTGGILTENAVCGTPQHILITVNIVVSFLRITEAG